MLSLLLLATLVPLYNISNVNNSEAAGTAQDSSITFTGTKMNASVDLTVASTSGTFATSNDSSRASFSISTSNSQGYTLTLESSASGTGATNLTNSTSGTSLSTITSSSISDNFSVGTWGLLPSSYKSGETVTNNNATTYFPAPTSGNALTLDSTSSANAEAKSYTIGIGAKADFSTASGTYTKAETYTIAYVANPTAYTITYADNTDDATISNMPTTIQSGAVSATSTTISPTYESGSAPTRIGFTFKAWCLGTVSENGTVCTGMKYNTGDTLYLDRTSTNNITLYAVWTASTYTLTVVDGGNTTVSGSGTYQYGEVVTVTAAPTSNTTCTSYSTPTWTKSDGATGELSATSGESITYTIGTTNDTITATSAAANRTFTITFKTSNASSIKFNGTNKSNNTTGSYACGNYSISGNYASGYGFSSWSRTGSGGFTTSSSSTTTTASSSTASTYFRVDGTATITLTGIFTGTYMQDFTKANCQSLAPSGNYTVYDRRDNNSYTVRYINGNCWMTQNLRIKGTISATYSNFSSPSSITFDGDFSSGEAVVNKAFYHDSGNSTYGVWYNLCAAGAKATYSCANSYSSDPSDICPSGWRRPTYDEARNIFSYKDAFSPVTGGYYNSRGENTFTNTAHWWTSTMETNQFQYTLLYGTSSQSLSIGQSFNKVCGAYIRCIRDN